MKNFIGKLASWLKGKRVVDLDIYESQDGSHFLKMKVPEIISIEEARTLREKLNTAIKADEWVQFRRRTENKGLVAILPPETPNGR